ncbi:MAG TPA: FAD-dependent oxidoreductase [Thermoanaerobaculia bacterium]
MRTAEIAIIGAGVVGASVAAHLARRGVRNIVVVDRATEFGAGSTSKATGGFRAQFATESNVRLSMLSREELEIDARGYLFLATTEEELDALRAAQAVQHTCGLHEARMITAAEARALNPAIGDASVVGGAFCPTDGFVRPMDVLRKYVDEARALGVRFELGVEEVPSAGIVVNCKGAWAGAPVTPLRRNVAATIETNVLPPSMPMTIWSGDWYHLRVRDGRVLLLWPDDPPNEDDVWLSRVRALTDARVPCLRDIPIDHTWTGLYEMSPDEHALLGRWGDQYVAIGNSGHGVMHAPALGRLLAEIIVDGAATSMDVSALDPARFGGGAGERQD